MFSRLIPTTKTSSEFIPKEGFFSSQAKVFIMLIPILVPVKSPGPRFTPKTSMSLRVSFAFRRVLSSKPIIFTICFILSQSVISDNSSSFRLTATLNLPVVLSIPKIFLILPAIFYLPSFIIIILKPDNLMSQYWFELVKIIFLFVPVSLSSTK